MKPLLLHACCAPCSLEPVRLLREEGFEPMICWTNPNIQPRDEWQRRLDELRRWCADGDIELIEAGEDRGRWETGVAPLGADRPRRCRACYALRLAEACRVAQERGFEFVGTTLAVSPYQLFDTCNDVLERLAAAHGLTPVIRDFRPYYPEATRRSRELGMYRQNYCGCRFSAVEAAMDRARIRDGGRTGSAGRPAWPRWEPTEPVAVARAMPCVWPRRAVWPRSAGLSLWARRSSSRRISCSKPAMMCWSVWLPPAVSLR